MGTPEASIATVLTKVVTEIGTPAVPPIVCTIVIVEYLTVVGVIAGDVLGSGLDDPEPAEGVAVTTDVSTDAGALFDAGGGSSLPGAADDPDPPGLEDSAEEADPGAPAEVATVTKEGDAEVGVSDPKDDPDPAGVVPDGAPIVIALVTTEGSPNEGVPLTPGADTITEITLVVSEPGTLEGSGVVGGTLALGAPGVTTMVVTRGGSVPPGLAMVVTIVMGGAGVPGDGGPDGDTVALGAPGVVISVTGGIGPDTEGSPEDGRGEAALEPPILVTTVMGGGGPPAGTLELGAIDDGEGEDRPGELEAPDPGVTVTTSGGIDIDGIDVGESGSLEVVV